MLSEPWRSPPTATPATLNLDTHHDVLAQERPRDASNRVAVLDVRWPRDVGRAPAVDAGLAALVRLCGPALITAVTLDATARSARSSAAQLLPEAPASGLDLSAVTRPACDELPFGGDWSDSIRLGPARTAVLIGDVVGHAASAALLMLRVRDVFTDVIRADPPTGTVFARAFGHLAALGKPFLGTAALFTFDTAADTLEFATAGHPPALLRTPDGQVARLTDGHGPALGLSSDEVSPGRRPFTPGSTLLAYTDGLVESRVHDIDEGIDRIAGVLRHLPPGPPPAATQILDHVLRTAPPDQPHRDDVTALVINRI